MLGFRLMIWALAAIVRKLPQVVLITALPALGVYMAIQLVNLIVEQSMTFKSMTFNGSEYIYTIGYIVLPAPFISWASINWHRARITGAAASPIPYLKEGLFLQHLWRLIALTSLIVAISIAYFYGIEFLFTRQGIDVRNEIILGLILLGIAVFYVVGMIYIFLRLAPSLAGTNVGDGTTFRQSWTMTAPYTPAILVIGFTILLGTFGFLITIELLLGFGVWIWIAALWFAVLFILSVLTEFYAYIRAQTDVSEIFG